MKSGTDDETLLSTLTNTKELGYFIFSQVDLFNKYSSNLLSRRLFCEKLAETIIRQVHRDSDENLMIQFINAIVFDSDLNPDKLHDVNEVWSEEWDEILKDVDINEKDV